MTKSTTVGGAFPAGWPADCPPSSASDATGDFYRVVKQAPCVARDFQSQAELGRKPEAPGCLRAGLSLLADYDSARHYRDKYPSMGTMIARGQLEANHGKITSPPRHGHTTWWWYEGVQRHALFVRVDETE